MNYDDYSPEAAALIEVEILDPEEQTGPTLGRVLGNQHIDIDIDIGAG